jgi:hypothetical protein
MVTVEISVEGPLQSVVVNRLYVTVPLGLYPPLITAESVADCPTVMVVADKVVDIVGLALFTVSSAHPLVTGLLFESPK